MGVTAWKRMEIRVRKITYGGREGGGGKVKEQFNEVINGGGGSQRTLGEEYK